MSRNLYKLIQELEERVNKLERKNALLENNINHLETLMRLKDRIPERPFFPTGYPEQPWYKAPNPTWLDNNDSITNSPKFTCSANCLDEKKDSDYDEVITKIIKDWFNI